MKKSEMKEIVKKASENTKLINAFFNYDQNYYNLIPLKLSNDLFLSINEDDFIFDGYKIFRFRDLIKVRIKNDLCDTILRNEGLITDNLMPDIDVNCWESVFSDLNRMNRNIIIQKQTKDGKDEEFIIGRITKIYKNSVYIWNFDADGIWDEEPTKVPYSGITSITFGSRYVDVFSKYISESPFK